MLWQDSELLLASNITIIACWGPEVGAIPGESASEIPSEVAIRAGCRHAAVSSLVTTFIAHSRKHASRLYKVVFFRATTVDIYALAPL
jgi:hypothetical protein